MLDVSGLEQQLSQTFHESIPEAAKQALLSLSDNTSGIASEKAEEFGNILDDMLSENWAKCIANAIDYYIKTGAIYGTILTTGSPYTQMAAISPINMGNPTAGSVPNTLGIK